jgi:tetratricopeptide (TPR) repeat protein
LAIGWGLSGSTYSFMGEGQQAIKRATYALSLSPLDPFAYFYQTVLNLAHYVNGTFEEAVLWGRKARAASPRFKANLRMLAASLVALDRIEEAREVAGELLRLEPGFSVERFCNWYPLKGQERRDLLATHLLAAGLPK